MRARSGREVTHGCSRDRLRLLQVRRVRRSDLSERPARCQWSCRLYSTRLGGRRARILLAKGVLHASKRRKLGSSRGAFAGRVRATHGTAEDVGHSR